MLVSFVLRNESWIVNEDAKRLSDILLGVDDYNNALTVYVLSSKFQSGEDNKIQMEANKL